MVAQRDGFAIVWELAEVPIFLGLSQDMRPLAVPSFVSAAFATDKRGMTATAPVAAMPRKVP